MGDKQGPWICCQLGAREHYAVPRALMAVGWPCRLLTEAWVNPGTLLGKLKRNLRERYQPDLAHGLVHAWNARSLSFELAARARRLSGWRLIRARNRWFQRRVVRALEAGSWEMEDRRWEMEEGNKVEAGRPQIADRTSDASNFHRQSSNSSRTLFAYSYAARDILRFAKQRRWRSVLGQIDPGPPEERIVAKLHHDGRSEIGDRRWEPAPAEYWADWREECTLADRIVVNSMWSRQALIEEGVPKKKIRVIPLAYENTGLQDHGTTGLRDCQTTGVQDDRTGLVGPWSVVRGPKAERHYPEQFTTERPLRVLFLGQINLRKGVGPLMDAARMLRDQPIEFWMVGPVQIDVPADLHADAKFRWTGAVPRSAAADFYRDADVFLFPTFSDGFGLTQLEAQAWRLPIIASKFCGEVVANGHNGLVLPEVSAAAIAEALKRCLSQPDRLGDFASNAVPPERFGLKRIGEMLLEVFD